MAFAALTAEPMASQLIKPSVAVSSFDIPALLQSADVGYTLRVRAWVWSGGRLWLGTGATLTVRGRWAKRPWRALVTRPSPVASPVDEWPQLVADKRSGHVPGLPCCYPALKGVLKRKLRRLKRWGQASG